jgi:hypothetical protein
MSVFRTFVFCAEFERPNNYASMLENGQAELAVGDVRRREPHVRAE